MGDKQIGVDFLTTQQLANRLGYSYLWISRLIKAGHIAAVKPPFGGSRSRWWIPLSEVDRLTEALDRASEQVSKPKQVASQASAPIDKHGQAAIQVDKPKWVPKKVSKPKQVTKPVDKPKKPKQTAIQIDEPEQAAKPKKSIGQDLLEMFFDTE